MPGCSALNCSERSEKGVRLFALPQGMKNKDRRDQWIRNIGRDNLSYRAFVCEKHFTQNQFENHRADGRRLLRWNAVPTIFSHRRILKAKRGSAVLSNNNAKTNFIEVVPANAAEAIVKHYLEVNSEDDLLVKMEGDPLALEGDPFALELEGDPLALELEGDPPALELEEDPLAFELK